MEERRSNGFRVKPSFGQVLGYIAEGEPLDIPLPNRKASIYTASHWYLDDYPNAHEPISDAPLPHTTINPAAAFETADEGYDGVPFPRPPREFTRPSFLPDSDDGGMDPGQALRNDGLNPPRPPTLGGRLRESGIQAAETIIAGGAAGAAAASQSFAESRTFNALRGGEDWLDRTLRIPRRPPGLGPPPDEVPPPRIIGRPSEVEPLLERAGQRAAEVERAAAQDIEQFATQQLAEAEPRRQRLRRQGPKRQLRRKRAEELWRCWEREPWRRQGRSALRREAWPLQAQARRWWARPGPSKEV